MLILFKIYNYNKEERFINDGYLFFSKISSAQVLEGTSYEVPEDLIYTIEKNIKELDWLGYDQNHYNILSYLRDCARYDKEPYQRSYAIVDGIDDEVLSKSGKYNLSLTQTDQMVRQIKNQTKRLNELHSLKFYELVLNVLAINTYKGLFIVAYKNVFSTQKLNL